MMRAYNLIEQRESSINHSLNIDCASHLLEKHTNGKSLSSILSSLLSDIINDNENKVSHINMSFIGNMDDNEVIREWITDDKIATFCLLEDNKTIRVRVAVAHIRNEHDFEPYLYYTHQSFDVDVSMLLNIVTNVANIHERGGQ